MTTIIEPQEPQEPRPAAARTRPNRYAGTCALCGGQVAPKAGILKGEKGNWITEHKPLQCIEHIGTIEYEFPPSPEQQGVLDAFATGESMVIKALAGTGKTCTLRMCATWLWNTDRSKKIQYVAFNKKIAAEVAGTMPPNTVCENIHKVAMRAVGRPYKHRLDAPRMSSRDIASRLGLDRFAITIGGMEKRVLSEEALAGLTMKAITKFCQSADEKPTRRHVAYIDGIDLPDAHGNRTYSNNNLIAEYLEPFLVTAWIDLTNPAGQLRFTHDHYMKIWQLSDPVLNVDVILFDECQDANVLMADIVSKQHHAQVVWVGDEHQCQPSGTMVTVVESYRKGNRHTGIIPTRYRQVPIEEIAPGDVLPTFDMGRSFLRRQGRRVRGVASRPYEGSLITATLDGHVSRYTPEHRCVVRVGDAFEGKWCVYLMRRGCSFRVGMVRGVYESQNRMLGLSMRAVAEKADGAWVLSTHDTEAEARLAEAATAWSYGVPSLRFVQGIKSGILQADLDRFWDKMGDLSDRASICLRAFGRLLDHPFCSGSTRVYRRRSQEMVAANVLSGMLMLPMTGALDASGKQVPQKHWKPVVVRSEFYQGLVHSLDVEVEGTYVADGIVTHNSIYGFTGAINSIERLQETGITVAQLSQSYRFGPSVADVANGILDELDPDHLRVRGFDQVPSVVGRIDGDPDAILTRTNAAAVDCILSAQERGVSAALVGGGEQVLNFARAAGELMERGYTGHPELACFSSWASVQAYVKQDEQGEELRLLVDLVDRYTVPVIVQALGNMPDEADAELIISTAHKAKGCEWDSVRLASDFVKQPPKPGELPPPPTTEERRLQYVAVTRARLRLDHTALLEVAGPEPEREN